MKYFFYAPRPPHQPPTGKSRNARTAGPLPDRARTQPNARTRNPRTHPPEDQTNKQPPNGIY